MEADRRRADRQPRWRDLNDDDRDRAYSPSSCLDGPLEPVLDEYRRRSDAAYEACPATTVAYGTAPTQTFDITVPEITVPERTESSDIPGLHVFIHGGYWQRLSKKDSFFLAPKCRDEGLAFAAIDYTLAPAASVEAIVSECVAALGYLARHGADLGIDPNRIVVSGSSAGAHLTAAATSRLPVPQRPAGLVLVSGIYELEPLIGTSINDALSLDVVSARAVSPLLADVVGFPPTVVTWGSNETDEFKLQSRAFADHLDQRDIPVAEHQVEGRNHFDIVYDIVPDLIGLLPRR